MKTFCPNCEKEVEGTFVCEVYACRECDKDFESYENPLTTKFQSEVDRLQIVIEAKQQIINKLAKKMLATSQDMVTQSNNITLEEYIKYLELKEQAYVNKNLIKYGCEDPE